MYSKESKRNFHELHRMRFYETYLPDMRFYGSYAVKGNTCVYRNCSDVEISEHLLLFSEKNVMETQLLTHGWALLLI